MPETAGSVQDKETTPIIHPHGTYKQYLDDIAPGETLAAKKLYIQIDELEASEKCWELECCRTVAWFVRHEETGQVRISSKKCHLRWCYHCAESRQNFITSQVHPWWARAKLPKLLTLTLQHTSAPLEQQIDLLYRSFQKLRNRQPMKKKCIAGVWFFQITRNHETNTWHPHLHALIDSAYLKHDLLKKAWCQITGGSTIIHIKAVIDTAKTLSHCARYAARPSSLINLTDSEALELYQAFQNRRIVGAWGKAKAISFRQTKPVDSEKWKNIGSWQYVFSKVGKDIRADRIVFSWGTGAKLEDGNDLHRLEAGFEDNEVNDAPEKIPKRHIQTTLF